MTSIGGLKHECSTSQKLKNEHLTDWLIDYSNYSEGGMRVWTHLVVTSHVSASGTEDSEEHRYKEQIKPKGLLDNPLAAFSDVGKFFVRTCNNKGL